MPWSLLLEEVKSLPRGRWTLLAAAIWLSLLTFLAALVLGTEGPGLYSFLVMAYVVPTLGLLPITAGYVASDRSSRFVQAVFTSPVRRGGYFAAKLAPPLTVGLAYLAATLPFLAVFAVHVGVPPLAWSFLLLSLALMVCCVALGGLFGILFVGRTTAAAVGSSASFAAFSGVAVFGLPMVLGLPDGLPRKMLMALIHASPLTLAFDATGLYGFVRAVDGLASGLGFALLTLGALGLGGWIFVRHQAAETWETTRGGRLRIAAALVLLAVLPAGLANATYAPAPPSVWQGQASPNGVDVHFVLPGLPMRSLETQPTYDNGKPTPLDALVVFRREVSFPLLDVRLESTSTNATLAGAHAPRIDGWEPPEPDATPRVLRIPVTATFHSAGVLGRMPVEISYLFSWTDGNGTRHQEAGRALVRVHEPGAPLQLALAGTPALFLCVGGYALRRWRTR